MRISDWSSDVCSSDLLLAPRHHDGHGRKRLGALPGRGRGGFLAAAQESEQRRYRDHCRDGYADDDPPALAPLGEHAFVEHLALKRPAPPSRRFEVHGPHSLYTDGRSEEHTSELQSLMRISYAVFC